MAGLVGWVFIGRLVTLDDDEPEGWSNPVDDGEVWRSSLRSLAVKGLVFGVIVVAGLAFPALRSLGAS